VNNDLNMQLIEQLTSVEMQKMVLSLDTITQNIHNILSSQLNNYTGITYYTSDDHSYEAKSQYPTDHKTNLPIDDANVATALQTEDHSVVDGAVYLPIYHGDVFSGVFVINFSGNDDLNQLNWVVLQKLIQQLTRSSIQLDTSQQQYDTVINTAYDVSVAENDTEIVELLFEVVPSTIQHIALYRFPVPINVNNPPLSINLRVLANRDGIIESDQSVLFTKDNEFSKELTTTLLSGEFINETDINDQQSKLPASFFNVLQSAEIKSCLITGLRVSQQLMGLLVLGNDTDLNLDVESYRNMRIVADQIGITFENQRLLRRTEVSLMETQLQYAISNDLVTSKSLSEMLRILLQYFGDNADGAGLVEVEYDHQGLVVDAILQYQIKPNDTTIYEPRTSLLDYTSLDALQTLQTAWAMSEIPVYFIEDDKDRKSELPIEVFIQQGIKSCIFIPLVEDHLVTHIISINWAKPYTYPDRTRQLLNNIRKQLDIIYQNQKLLQQSQITSARLAGQIQTQRALNDLSTFASSNQDEKLLLDKGAETLKQVMNVDHVGIMLIEDNREWVYLASETPINATEHIRIPYDSAVWETLNHDGYRLISNVNDGVLTEGLEKAAENVGVSSTLIVPIYDISGHLIGSVGLDKYEGELKLSDEQIQTARLINAQLATQLQNLRLLQDSQQLAEQMQQIARFGETVQSRLDLEEILQTTLHFAKRIIDADYISVVLYDESIEKLVIRAYHLDNFEVVFPPDTLSMSPLDTVAGKVWQTRESRYVSDLKDSDYTNPLSDKITSIFSTPLMSRGVTQGIFEVGYTSNRTLRQLDQSVLVQLANQLSVALENAITYSQSQRLAQNKILANEISLQLQQQTDIDSLLNTTVTELGKALGAKRARIRLGVQQVVEDQ